MPILKTPNKLSPSFLSTSIEYPSLKTELTVLFTELEENPTTGTPLGNDIYKIRLAIASKNKGKSGGARVLSFVKVTPTTVLLFSIKLFNKFY